MLTVSSQAAGVHLGHMVAAKSAPRSGFPPAAIEFIEQIGTFLNPADKAAQAASVVLCSLQPTPHRRFTLPSSFREYCERGEPRAHHLQGPEMDATSNAGYPLGPDRVVPA